MPVIPATWEAETGESFEAEVAVSRESSIALQPGQQERNSVSKRKKEMYILLLLGREFCVSLVGPFGQVLSSDLEYLY